MTGPVPGTITTLQWIKPGVERRTEDALGFNANRLAAGYWILFLKTLPDEKAFEFDGTTMRSGGREGLPAKSWGIDQTRPRVHEKIYEERGSDGYQALQKAALKLMSISGEKRLCKVVPLIPHTESIMPDEQYPMGGGGLQWKLKKPGMSFLAAVRVDTLGRAHTVGESYSVRDSYDDRAALRQYMMTA